MFISYFEYKTRQIDVVKDKPNFIKEYGQEFMRAFQEEMEYFAMKAMIYESIDLNVELDRIETKYRFNDDMNYLLDATAKLLREAVLEKYWGWKKNEISEEAKVQIVDMCRLMVEQIDHSVHIHMRPPQTYYPQNDALERVIHDLEEGMNNRTINNKEANEKGR